MINKQLTLHPTEPTIIGFMAVVYTKDKDDKVIIWHKSKVVTEEHDATLIIEQWKTQLGFGPGTGEIKYKTIPVYTTMP